VQRNEREGDPIDTLVGAIHDRGLAVPATLFLELMRPLNVVGSHLMLLVEPLMRPLLGVNGRRYATMLEDRRNVERLLDRLKGGGAPRPIGGKR